MISEKLIKLTEEKWIKKYMKIAKVLADDNSSCYSRKIGCVLVSEDNVPITFGYNGSVEGSPHTDHPKYLMQLWKKILTSEDKKKLIKKYKLKVQELSSKNRFICDYGSSVYYRFGDEKPDFAAAFINKFSDCKNCPRKLLDIKSGERLDLCNCSHSERNCIFNAAKSGQSTQNSVIYCYCGVPCHECSLALIQSGVKVVVCLNTGLEDYSKSSRTNFDLSGVKLIEVDKNIVG